MWFIPPVINAADIKSIGVPYVQNYTKSTYLSGNQNWSITRDEKGVMYFGNSEGLLSFDGRNWQLYPMPNHIIVRAVAADGNGRIYVGGFGELGYWSYNKNGNFFYTSLTRLIQKKFALADEIWKISTVGRKVLFQSFSSIYIYENGKISGPVKASAPFLFMYNVSNRVFIEVISKGLYELKAQKLAFINGSEVLAGAGGVLSILPFSDTSYIIGTAKKGLFLYDGHVVKPWLNQADSFLTTYQLNNGTIVLDKYFAFGTILNGIVIIDRAGNIVQHINKSSGLQNNTVLSLFADEEQSFWTGLDNGIDRIELNSPLYFYFDKTGKFGTVYSSIIYNDKIYLGTNQGLFYSKLPAVSGSFQSFDFQFVPESQGQVWNLSLLDGQLLCGHNEGTFVLSDNLIRKISSVNGGWVIKELYNEPGLLLQGTYTGLVVYKKDNRGKWEFARRIKNFSEPSRYVEADSRGNIWVSHAYKGVYKLVPDRSFDRILVSKYYDGRNGLPGSYNVNVFNLEHHIVFSSDSGFYVYDDITDRFSKYNQLNSLLGSFSTSNKIIEAADKKYWFINHGRVALVDFSRSGKASIDSNRLSMLDGRMVQYYENISRIGKSMYLISVDDGFAIFNEDINLESRNKPRLAKVLIRKVENITDKVYTITENGSISRELRLPYSQNNIRISFALPYYRQAKVKYQYFLKGYSGQWSEWSTQTQKDFTNLSNGSYEFKVRAVVDGMVTPNEAVFEFVILPPWYKSNWAIIFYILLHICLILFLRYLYLLKLKKHQEKIQAKLQQEKEEYLRHEVVVNEQKIVTLKNAQLQADLASKSRELANSVTNIVYKNELLQKIKEEIYALKDSSGKKLSEEQLRKIQKVIDEGMTDESDWNLFEKSFNEAHENFFKKLKAKHPDIVPNDLKLCAYLRMNMSSKEIASLLNISLRGVEIRRYRLRKKLNVEHDKNLVEFLLEL